MLWLVALLIAVFVMLVAPLVARAKRRSKGEISDHSLTRAGAMVTATTLSLFAFAVVGPHFITAPKLLWATIGVIAIFGGLGVEALLKRRGIKLLKPIK